SRVAVLTIRAAFWAACIQRASARSSRSGSMNTAFTCRPAYSKAPRHERQSGLVRSDLRSLCGVHCPCLRLRRRCPVLRGAVPHPQPRRASGSPPDRGLRPWRRERHGGDGAAGWPGAAGAKALPLKVGEYLLLRFALGAFLAFMGWLLGLAAVIVLGLGCAGYAAPALYVQRRRQARLRQFEDQLVDALTLIANALKSGYSFLQGIEAVAREMPPPLGAEFEQVVREIRVGGSAEEALLKLCERVPSQDLELVVTAMIIQRQVGGNLADILSNIAYTVRERHRILREIRVLTAQERMSGNVVAGIPLALVLLMSITTPTYVSGMWATNAGKAMLGAGFVMELIGLLVIRRMVELEV